MSTAQSGNRRQRKQAYRQSAAQGRSAPSAAPSLPAPARSDRPRRESRLPGRYEGHDMHGAPASVVQKTPRAAVAQAPAPAPPAPTPAAPPPAPAPPAPPSAPPPAGFVLRSGRQLVDPAAGPELDEASSAPAPATPAAAAPPQAANPHTRAVMSRIKAKKAIHLTLEQPMLYGIMDDGGELPLDTYTLCGYIKFHMYVLDTQWNNLDAAFIEGHQKRKDDLIERLIALVVAGEPVFGIWVRED